MSLISVLTVLFVVAKIGGFIDWSWWLVFAPLWGGVTVGSAFVLLLLFLDGKVTYRRRGLWR